MPVDPSQQQALHSTVESAVSRALDTHASRIDTSGFVTRHELDNSRAKAREKYGDEFKDQQFAARYEATPLEVIQRWD